MALPASEAEVIADFRDAMKASGIDIRGPIIADGKLHRADVEGDRKGSRNGWYVLHVDDRPAGQYGHNKLGNETKFSWTAEGTKPLTREERERMKANMEERKRLSDEATAREHAAARDLAARILADAEPAKNDHPYLRRKKVAAHGLMQGVYIKEWTDNVTGEARSRRFANALLVPMRDEAKVVHSLQAIFAEKADIGGQRDKDFVGGGRKQGLWHSIGKPTDIGGVPTIGLCEGYATGASVHEATGIGMLVCFDAGNLIHVARVARKLMPKARIFIAADNDQWTTKGLDKEPWNPGLEKATEAAQEIGAVVVAPWFKDVESKPTDWNDLHAQHGLAEVTRQVMAVLMPRKAAADEPPPPDAAPEGAHDGEYLPPEDYDLLDGEAFFDILGHDREMIYVYQREKRMVTARKESDWSENALLAIAPLNYWERIAPAKSGFDKKLAANAIIRTAFRKGYYDPSRCRGLGAWRDDGRFVFHFGQKLMVGDELVELTAHRSRFVYEQGSPLKLPDREPLSAADGKRLVEACKLFAFTREASALLLSGWCALAPLGGAMRWRPHIWITGGAGSGKTTALNFVHFLLNDTAIYAQGNSTEAGIRQELKTDARPIIFDESEQHEDKDVVRIQSVLSLLRQASTESAARTLKGTQTGRSMNFHIRSMACLASIQVGIKHQADLERLTVLALRPKKANGGGAAAAASWSKLRDAVAGIMADASLPARLMRRSLMLLPTTIENIEVFAQAAAEKFGSQREGDQYGALLAGAWSLISTKLASLDQARELIDRYDWTEYLEATETEESDKVLGALLGRQVRTHNRGDVTVYEILAAAAGRPTPGYDPGRDVAESVLLRHGMMVEWVTKDPNDALFLVAYNSLELNRLMKDTPYAADLKGQLQRLPGATKRGARRFNGVPSRSTALPLPYVLDGITPVTGELITDDDLAF